MTFWTLDATRLRGCSGQRSRDRSSTISRSISQLDERGRSIKAGEDVPAFLGHAIRAYAPEVLHSPSRHKLYWLPSPRVICYQLGNVMAAIRLWPKSRSMSMHNIAVRSITSMARRPFRSRLLWTAWDGAFCPTRKASGGDLGVSHRLLPRLTELLRAGQRNVGLVLGGSTKRHQ